MEIRNNPSLNLLTKIQEVDIPNNLYSNLLSAVANKEPLTTLRWKVSLATAAIFIILLNITFIVTHNNYKTKNSSSIKAMATQMNLMQTNYFYYDEN